MKKYNYTQQEIESAFSFEGNYQPVFKGDINKLRNDIWGRLDRNNPEHQQIAVRLDRINIEYGKLLSELDDIKAFVS